ncbi:PREDICTED: uncharacterized protein K02A2.6-like [Rhagoletis zephyria]|uniref:uncharacterized protein K02A2.6-like n=1 Tax=Rhagoletis zephyria TaxID=28612 RepID=UPI00081180B7|nr:PREDICTED: uncharacterized protein K02A2.6-like [Rhagoletis zephyria]
MRSYAEVSFLTYKELGLLDTGANISCIGSSLATEDFSKIPQFKALNSQARTADGEEQKIIGVLEILMTYKTVKRPMKLYVIPSIKQKLILGHDFWRTFSLAPNIISSLENSLDSTGTTENVYPLSQQQIQQLEVVKNLFPNATKGLGRTTFIQHHIDVGEAKPVKQRFYPVSPAVEKLLYNEIDRMLQLEVIEPSVSAWSSPMRLVVKPNNVRLCLDARRLNEVTKKHAYPLPSIDGIFSRLPSANIITKLDLKDVYWQIELSPESKPLTAFTVPGRPLYQFKVMPFGLCNAPSTMCRLMDEILPPDLRHCVFGYLDDLCIVSEDFSSHLTVLVRLAEQFRKANLTLNIDKSQFCVTSINYLGYIIGSGGKEHIVPDALSRLCENEISELDMRPIIDLESDAFQDEAYVTLKNKFSENPEKFPDIKIVDNLLYIRTEHAVGDGTEDKSTWKLWVPERLKNEALKQGHDSLTSSHAGIQKAIEKLRRYLFWPGLAKDVREYIRQCEICKENKAPNITLRPPMGAHIPTCRPFQKLYIDLLGPYPRSKNWHIGLLIVLDHFKNVFHSFGVPETLVSDNGTQFRANDFKAFLTELGIKQVFTALYSPQSNAAERVNRSLLAAIRSYLKKDRSEWDLHLSSISCSLRSALHQSLGCSPYRALFGLDMITHGSDYKLLKELSLLEEPIVPLSRSDNLALLRKDIQANIRKAYDKNVKQYNLRSKPVSYKEGQEVYRRNFALSKFSEKFNAKLGSQFVKCRIRKKLGSCYYQLEDLQGKEIGTYHAKDIRS